MHKEEKPGDSRAAEVEEAAEPGGGGYVPAKAHVGFAHEGEKHDAQNCYRRLPALRWQSSSVNQ